MKGLLPQPRFCGIISICSVKKKYFRNHSMFEQAFKNIDDVLWKEAGCSSELDYTEQASWLLFLKYLDDLEQDKSTEAALESKKYNVGCTQGQGRQTRPQQGPDRRRPPR